MANPQCENGFTKIANDLMDALCRCHPGGSEGQILLAILRKTYGWNKKSDHISISQLCDMTSVCRRTAIYAIHNLEAKNMIVVQRQKVDGLNECNMIELQKDYEKWIVQEIDGSARKSKSYKATIEKQKKKYHESKSEVVVQEMDSSARNSKIVVQENENDGRFLAPTKDTITKDNIQKKNTSAPNRKKASGSSAAPTKIKINLNLETYRWENITDEDLSRWKVAYPACDSTIELAKAAEWIRANPTKVKSNWLRFLTNWFSRSQERGGSNGGKLPNQRPKQVPSSMEDDDYYSGYSRA